ncbi:hypothetical protein OG373_33665 [Streptomyces avidinii]|uniref:hypothetical protein n=1 Tax=Streptomyces avidinii TaxID=1895 RepID=UPI0038691E05|nr:hypothetical protein OG373_33665 [Streptomyces avidinii]
MTTDLGLLTTAADKWESMAGEIKKVEDRYKDTVQKITMGPDWTGVSAGVAHTNFAGTRYEYAAAQTQAKAVASLLRDAHTQFVDLKRRLDSVCADAVKEGLVVDSRGSVRQDESKLTGQDRMYLRDHPEAVAALNKTIEAWAQRIKDLVQAFADADQGVKVALEAVGVDSNKDAFGKGADDQLNGFNAGAQGDIEVYEARNAEDIATRINSGEKVSAADYAELNRSFRDNSSRPEFTQTFLNGMGAENTLKFTNKLNDHAYGDDKGNKQRYLDLQKGLANSLSNAMQDPKSQFYKDFRAELKTAGLDTYDLKVAGEAVNTVAKGHGQEVRGYQSLVTLMQQGDGYSAPFLQDLATDIRKAEDKKQGGNPDVWDLYGDYNGKDRGWFANDPLDGVLGIMGRDPATSTSYLDPGADGKNDNLQYLLKDRDWDITNTTNWRGNIELDGTDKVDGDNRIGLGAVIEAGTTGHPAGDTTQPSDGKHSVSEARVMQSTVQLLDQDTKGDSIEANLRDPLARSLVDYAPDTHNTLTHDPRYAHVSGGQVLQDGDGGHLNVAQDSLTRVLRGVSDNPENFAHLYDAERAQAARSLAGADPAYSNNKDWENRTADVGMGAGVFNAIGVDVILDDRDAKKAWIDDVARYSYHGVGAPLTLIPGIGDTAQRMVDATTYEWSKDVKAEADQVANVGVAKEMGAKSQGSHDLINQWANGRGRDPMTDSVVNHLRDQSDLHYSASRNQALADLHRGLS